MEPSRRDFLNSMSATVLSLVTLSSIPSEEKASGVKKALQWGMLPKNLSDEEKMKLAYRCGFRGIEAHPMEDLETAKKFGDLAREIGVPVHSICYGGWKHPLSDPDPQNVEAGLRELEQALYTAKAIGADTVLLVPAVVTETVRYQEAWERSHANICKILPLAEELQVVIAVENVWNRFLLSPLEFARYVDEFQSPWLQAYFDVGNVILFGFSQDWIRTLGKRIRKIHLKDFRLKNFEWTNLGEGNVNWPEVTRALQEVNYTGYVTPELSEGDEEYLNDLSNRIDRLLGGIVESSS